MNRMQTTQLSHKFTHTVGLIFQHPVSHNLPWRDVTALMEHLGTVEEKDNGHLLFTVNSVTLAIHHPQGKEVSDVQQTLDIRHFLESAGVGKSGNVTTDGAKAAPPLRLLVVIRQQKTLIFRTEGKDALPERLYPYDPHGILHHLNHTDGRDKGSREPENLIYYKEIAKTLAGADEILLMGNGTGASSAMTHLRDFFATHHPEITQRIVGTVTLDLEALTEGQLLQEARAVFIRRDALNPKPLE